MTKSFNCKLPSTNCPLRVHILRSGVTLIELLIFLSLLAVVGGSVVFFLFITSEDRIRQDVRASVEQEGVQLFQGVTSRVERAERIILPPRLATGSILVLQMEVRMEDPTIIAVQSGILLLIQGTRERVLNSSGITVTQLRVRNTSASLERPSSTIAFTVSRSIPLPEASVVTRRFERAVTLFPKSSPQGNACGCAPPSCSGGWYTWGVCEAGVCRRISGSDFTVPLQCPS